MPSFVPPEILDEIIARTDIVEVIGAYVSLKKQGRNYVGLCPFHNEDTPSFTVSPEKQIFYCFGCQKGGNVLNFLMEEESLTLVEAGARLAGCCGVEIPKKPHSPAQAKNIREKQALYNIHKLSAEFYRQKLAGGSYPLAGEYLKKRGISREIQEKFSLGYGPEEDWRALADFLLGEGLSPQLLEKSGLCSKSPKNGKFYDKFHGRLIFPIEDYQGQIIAFGGRIIGEGQPKYLNSPQTPIYNKSCHLFGLKIAAPAIRKGDYAVIVEGYMDVIACHIWGLDNAVAPLGTAFTPQQGALLKRYTNNVLLAFDGDDAGAKATVRSIDILRPLGFNLKIMPFPQGMDPDDFLKSRGKEGWEEFSAQFALEPLEFLFNQAYEKYPGNTPAEKGRLVQELLPHIAKTTSQVERAGFISLLGQKLEVDEAIIYADLRKSGLKLPAPERKRNTQAVSIGIIGSPEPLLLRLMLENKAFYKIILEELGKDFFQDPNSLRLIALIKEMLPKEQWNAAGLLNNFSPQEEENDNKPEKDDLRQYLLKIFQIELPFEGSEEGKEHLLGEYIKACQIHKRQAKVKELTIALSSPDSDDRFLLEEISRLQAEIQRLKAASS